MSQNNTPPAGESPGSRHKRRPRYAGKYPRRFEQKYKELAPQRYPETVKKVLGAGKTPAGSHRPIMVREVLAVLAPSPGAIVVDCTLGYGGHATEFLPRIQPGGRLLGLDRDPIELAKTTARLAAAGFGPEQITTQAANFAALGQILAKLGVDGVDILFADLGVSSMQLDDPQRGFSHKHDGPLDMRMNPTSGRPASYLLESIRPDQLEVLLAENSDEPNASILGKALAGQQLATTAELAGKIRDTLSRRSNEEVELTLRRTFQALRIAVNDELGALDALLRQGPSYLKPGGRVAILSFHSGEDRRVKKSFAAGLRAGHYEEISEEVIRALSEERFANPRSAAAKLRWARAFGKV